MLFLHISDIHFKEKQVGQPDDPNQALRNDVIHDVRLMRERIGKSADCILLSGDIAFGGKAHEYDFAFRWLKEQLCPAAGCNLTDVFVIPGNHDVDRAGAKAPAQRRAREALRSLPLGEVDAGVAEYMHDALSSDVLFGPIENYNRFAAKFLCLLGPYVEKKGHPPTSPFTLRNFQMNDKSVLRIWGFNSVLVSNASDAPGNMIVDPAAAQIEREAGVCHLVMCHHPFGWLKNGGAFQDRIDAIAHIHLFGHEHTRRIEPHVDFVRVRAGALQPDRDSADWKPGYNWIDVSVEGVGDERLLDVKIWVRMHDTRPAQFLPVPDKWQRDPWPIKLKLETWYPPLEKSDSSVSIEPNLDTLDQSVSPENPTADARNAALRMSQLRVDQLESIMKSLDLNKVGDRNLKDYELGIVAVSRSIERKMLPELIAALNKVSPVE
jgi:hypothetical protein